MLLVRDKTSGGVRGNTFSKDQDELSAAFKYVSCK